MPNLLQGRGVILKEIFVKRYTFLHPLLLAFYSKSLYQQIGQKKRGWGLLYLLLLAAICSLPFTYRVYQEFTYLAQAAQPLVNQLPTITLKQGKVTVDKSEPCFIKMPGSDRIIAIIDTTGATNLNDNKAFVLLTKTRLLYKWDNKIKTRDLSQIKDTVYTPEHVSNLLWQLTRWLAVIFYPIITLVHFLVGLIQVVLYAGIVKLFLDVNLNYKALCRLAIVALTPAFMLAAVLHIVGLNPPYRWLIYIPLSLGYLLYAVRANLALPSSAHD